MVYIHRPLSRLRPSPMETISTSAPSRPNRQPSSPDNRSHWLHTKKCLEAAEIAVNLYTLPIPILQHSPLGIPGIALSTLANLSACAYTLHGADWYRTRDRVRLGLGGLKKLAEVWSIARRTERETKCIARSVFGGQPPTPSYRNQNGGVATQRQHINQGVSGGSFYGFPGFQEHNMGQQQDQLNMSTFDEELGSFGGGMDNHINAVNVEYLTMLDNSQPMSHIRS